MEIFRPYPRFFTIFFPFHANHRAKSQKALEKSGNSVYNISATIQNGNMEFKNQFG